MKKDIHEPDTLQMAKNALNYVYDEYQVGTEANINTAIAYALIALVERLDKLSANVNGEPDSGEHGKAIRIVKAEY